MSMPLSKGEERRNKKTKGNDTLTTAESPSNVGATAADGISFPSHGEDYNKNMNTNNNNTRRSTDDSNGGRVDVPPTAVAAESSSSPSAPSVPPNVPSSSSYIPAPVPHVLLSSPAASPSVSLSRGGGVGPVPSSSSRSIHRVFGSTRTLKNATAADVSKTEEEEDNEMLALHTTNRYSLLMTRQIDVHEKIHMRTTWTTDDFKCWLSLTSDFRDVLLRAIEGTEVRTREAASLKRGNTILSPFVLAVARRRQKERQDKANYRRAKLVELAHSQKYAGLIRARQAYEEACAVALVEQQQQQNVGMGSGFYGEGSLQRQQSSLLSSSPREGGIVGDGTQSQVGGGNIRAFSYAPPPRPRPQLPPPPPPVPPPPPFREVALPDNSLEDWIERLNCGTDWVVAVPADHTIPSRKTRTNIDNFLKWHLMVPITSTAKKGSWAHKALMTAERLKESYNVRSIGANIALGKVGEMDAEDAVTSVRMSLATERRFMSEGGGGGGANHPSQIGRGTGLLVGDDGVPSPMAGSPHRQSGQHSSGDDGDAVFNSSPANTAAAFSTRHQGGAESSNSGNRSAPRMNGGTAAAGVDLSLRTMPSNSGLDDRQFAGGGRGGAVMGGGNDGHNDALNQPSRQSIAFWMNQHEQASRLRQESTASVSFFGGGGGGGGALGGAAYATSAGSAIVGGAGGGKNSSSAFKQQQRLNDIHSQNETYIRSSLRLSTLSEGAPSHSLTPSDAPAGGGGEGHKRSIFTSSNTRNTNASASGSKKKSKETLEMEKMLKFVDRQRNRYVSAMSPIRCGIDVYVRGEDGKMYGPGSRMGAGIQQQTSPVGNGSMDDASAAAAAGTLLSSSPVLGALSQRIPFSGASSPPPPHHHHQHHHSPHLAPTVAGGGGQQQQQQQASITDASSYPYEGELRLFGEGWGKKIEFNRIPILKIEQVRLSSFLSPESLRDFNRQRSLQKQQQFGNGGNNNNNLPPSRRGGAAGRKPQQHQHGFSSEGNSQVMMEEAHEEAYADMDDESTSIADFGGDDADDNDGSPTITVLLIAKSFFVTRPVSLGATSYYGLRFDTSSKALRFISEVDASSRLLQYLTDEVVKIISSWVSYDLTPPPDDDEDEDADEAGYNLQKLISYGTTTATTNTAASAAGEYFDENSCDNAQHGGGGEANNTNIALVGDGETSAADGSSGVVSMVTIGARSDPILGNPNDVTSCSTEISTPAAADADLLPPSIVVAPAAAANGDDEVDHADKKKPFQKKSANAAEMMMPTSSRHRGVSVMSTASSAQKKKGGDNHNHNHHHHHHQHPTTNTAIAQHLLIHHNVGAGAADELSTYLAPNLAPSKKKAASVALENDGTMLLYSYGHHHHHQNSHANNDSSSFNFNHSSHHGFHHPQDGGANHLDDESMNTNNNILNSSYQNAAAPHHHHDPALIVDEVGGGAFASNSNSTAREMTITTSNNITLQITGVAPSQQPFSAAASNMSFQHRSNNSFRGAAPMSAGIATASRSRSASVNNMMNYNNNNHSFGNQNALPRSYGGVGGGRSAAAQQQQQLRSASSISPSYFAPSRLTTAPPSQRSSAAVPSGGTEASAINDNDDYDDLSNLKPKTKFQRFKAFFLCRPGGGRNNKLSENLLHGGGGGGGRRGGNRSDDTSSSNEDEGNADQQSVRTGTSSSYYRHRSNPNLRMSFSRNRAASSSPQYFTAEGLASELGAGGGGAAGGGGGGGGIVGGAGRKITGLAKQAIGTVIAANLNALAIAGGGKGGEDFSAFNDYNNHNGGGGAGASASLSASPTYRGGVHPLYRDPNASSSSDNENHNGTNDSPLATRPSVGGPSPKKTKTTIAQQMALDAMTNSANTNNAAVSGVSSMRKLTAPQPQPSRTVGPQRTAKGYQNQKRIAMKQMESAVRIIRSCTLHAQDKLQSSAISERRQHYALSIAVETYLHSQLYACMFTNIQQMSCKEDERLDRVRDHFYEILMTQQQQQQESGSETKKKKTMSPRSHSDTTAAAHSSLLITAAGDGDANAHHNGDATGGDNHCFNGGGGDHDAMLASGVSSPACSPKDRMRKKNSESNGGDDDDNGDDNLNTSSSSTTKTQPIIDAVYFGASPTLKRFNPFVYRRLVAGINDNATSPLDKLQRIRALFLQVAEQAELVNAYNAFLERKEERDRLREENGIPPKRKTAAESHASKFADEAHVIGGVAGDDYRKNMASKNSLSHASNGSVGKNHHNRNASFASSISSNAGLDDSFVMGFGNMNDPKNKKQGICADDVVALLSLVLLACPCANLYSQVTYLVTFSSEATEEDSELEYAFVSFRVAVENLLQEERRLSGEVDDEEDCCRRGGRRGCRSDSSSESSRRSSHVSSD